MAKMKAPRDLRATRQRTLAGTAGGLAQSARYTRAERSEMRRRGAHTRFANMALDECKTEAERAALEANEPELERRAKLWARRVMAPVRAIHEEKRAARKAQQQERADEVMTITALALATAARLNAAQRRIAELEARLAS